MADDKSRALLAIADAIADLAQAVRDHADQMRATGHIAFEFLGCELRDYKDRRPRRTLDFYIDSVLRALERRETKGEELAAQRLDG